MLKKTLLIAAAVLITAVAIVTLENTSQLSANVLSPFSDVSETSDQFTAINYLNGEELLMGNEDGSFEPEGDLNRAEMVKIAVLISGVLPSGLVYNNCFEDVKDEWYAPYICYAKERGWVDGYQDGQFQPKKIINKAELLKVLFNSKNIEIAQDDQAIWYEGFIKEAEKSGLLDEESELFDPNELIKRALACEYIYRFDLKK
jgi:hypothetical protein